MFQLTNVRLLVSDFPACFRFYRDVMGFEVGWGDEEGGYADFKTGQTTMALFGRQEMAEAIGEEERPAEAHSQDRAALIFAVPNVDAAWSQLREQGVTLVSEPQDRSDWGIRAAHFRDPDGNLIEINQPVGR